MKQKYGMSKQRLFFIAYIIVFLIPVITSGILGYSLINYFVIDTYIENMEEKIDHQNSILDTYMKTFELIQSETNQKYFRNRYMLESKVVTYLEIEKYLRTNEFRNEAIAGLYFYNTVTETVHSSNGTYKGDFFFDTEFDREFIGGNSFEHVVRGTFVQGNNRINDKPLILLIYPVEKDYQNNLYVSYMIYKLDYDFLNSVFMTLDTSGNTSYVMKYEEEPIFSTNKEQNRIIAEESAEGYLTSLSSEDYVVRGTEHNRLEIEVIMNQGYFRQKAYGLIMIQSITLLGIASLCLMIMLMLVKRSYEPIKAILDKVRKTVDSQETSDDYQMIDFVLDELVHNKKVLEEMNESLKREKLLYHILRNNKGSFQKVFLDECTTAGLNVNSEAFLCCVVYKFGDEGSKLIQMLEGALAETSNDIARYVMSLTEIQSIYLYCGSKTAIDQLYDYLGQLKVLESEGSYIGIGLVSCGLNLVYRSFNHAQSTSQYAQDNELSVCFEIPKGQKVNYYPKMDLEILESAVKESEFDKVVFALNSLKNYIEDSGDYFVGASIYSSCLSIIDENLETITLEDELSQFVLTDIFENIPSSTKEIENRLSVLTYGFSDNGALIKNGKGKKYKKIDNVVSYIDEYYLEDNFSIKYMAAYMDTTPSNLSQYFKKYTGRNMSEYIDSLRIIYAKKQLDKRNVSIKDISKALGYSNASAFIKKFKKITGHTPGEYKHIQDYDLLDNDH